MLKNRILFLSLIALAAISNAYAANETPASQPSTPGEQAAMRDLKLNLGQLRALQQTEKLAARRGAELEVELGSSFAGIYLRRNSDSSFSVVLKTKGLANLDPRAEQPDVVEPAAFSLSELEEIKESLVKSARTFGEGRVVHSVSVLIPENAIELVVDTGANTVAKTLISAAAAPTGAVRVVEQDRRPRAAFNGGDRFRHGTSGDCSIGFAAHRDWDSSEGFFAAGHCADLNTAVRTTGNVSFGTVEHRVYGGQDFEWARITNPAFTVYPQVSNHSTGSNPVFGMTELAYGSSLCRSGFRTGWKCGIVTSTDTTVQYMDGTWLSNMRESSACAGPGDSGGSVISTSGEAQGVVSGINSVGQGMGNPNCGYSGARSFYSPIKTALAWTANVVLRTVQSCGRMTSGYRLFGTSLNRINSINSCNGQWSIKQVSGWLKLYRYNTQFFGNIGYIGSGGYLIMEKDGDLLAKQSNGQAQLLVQTSSQGADLILTDVGSLEIRGVSGGAAWVQCIWAGTPGRCDNFSGP